MSLRDLVTGSDMCTAADAGPSNAAASLANTLLGGSAKQQERLAELPGMAAGAGPSSYAAVQLPSMEQAVQHAVHGSMPAIPGLTNVGPMLGSHDVDEFVRDMQQQQGHPGMPDFGEFDEIFHQQAALHGPHHGPHLPPHMAGPPAAIQHSLQAFLNSSKNGSALSPLPGPPMQLSLPDQCRIRDRSSILARQLFVDQGHDFADQQVRRLLHSLHINAEALPAQVPEEKWDDIFRISAGDAWANEMAASELASAGQAAARQLPGDGWVDEFSGLRVSGPDGWAEEFTTQAAGVGVSGIDRALQSGDSMKHTRALVETLSHSDDPKMKNSKFLQFVSKMSRGEVILEDNQAKEVPAEAANWVNDYNHGEGASGWAQEFSNGDASPGWIEEFGDRVDGHLGASTSGAGPDIAVDWAQEFADNVVGGAVDTGDIDGWVDQFTSDVEDWDAEYRRRLEQLESIREGDLLQQQEYVFSANNPFMNDLNSFAKAKDLFRSGLLSEAVLALEAEVQRQDGNVDAWRLLGTVHAENDDDRQAIAALSRALVADPNNLEALLSLGVSHTNELDQSHAMNYLRKWLEHHPQHSSAISGQPDLDKSQSLKGLVNLFERAANLNPQDADVHAALGVLYNLARDYDKAVTSFRFALSLRSNDYSLWNKLGATLANSNHSAEAITAYQQALDAKPNYMRAWTNMGIANANLGQYEESARYYTRALTLNRHASGVWSYLRTSLMMSGRHELLDAVDNEDLNRLAVELGLS